MVMTAGSVGADVAKGDRNQVDGEMVRGLMLALGDLSKGDFAVVVGVNDRTVARWRAGGVDLLTWRGALASLGLKISWRPGDVIDDDIKVKSKEKIERVRAMRTAGLDLADE